MPFELHHTPVHKHTIVTTEPVRGSDIQKVRDHLQGRPRDLAIWSVGTNSALSASNLVALTWDDVDDDGERITLFTRERKTAELRRIVMNTSARADLRAWRRLSPSHYVFAGQRGSLTTATLGRLVKSWVKDAGVVAWRISSHTLRKTWCRALIDQHDEPLFKIMWALGHSNERTTAAYLGLLTNEVQCLYDHIV